MKKILFLIHDLGQGGAEKVLVNLVNNIDRSKFEVTIMALFGGGVNEQFLAKDINYITIYEKMFRGNSHLMKLFTPKQLHKLYIKQKYDIEISYLEGPCARIISGCPHQDTKLVSWIHVEQHTISALAQSFRKSREAIKCYNKFDQTVCVSEYVKNDFSSILDFKKPICVLYNTIESDKILKFSELPCQIVFVKDTFNLIAVGTLKKSKGYQRLLSVVLKLINDGFHLHLYILGIGNLKPELDQFIQQNKLTHNVTFLGYDENPYKYVSKADLFVCASYSEGFSTAATEALIVGTPVCTVDVSGMKEMLGENSEYGIVVENSEEGLYQGIKKLLLDKELLAHYKKQAKLRGSFFSKEKTVKAVEEMLEGL
jgi:glycosyltransferase involved in cell wall biosynthesis